MLNISILTDGAAFEPPETGRECARILRHFADALETRVDGSAHFILRAADVNGNFCAIADFAPEPEPDADGRT